VIGTLYSLLEEGHIDQNQCVRLQMGLDWIQYSKNLSRARDCHLRSSTPGGQSSLRGQCPAACGNSSARRSPGPSDQGARAFEKPRAFPEHHSPVIPMRLNRAAPSVTPFQKFNSWNPQFPESRSCNVHLTRCSHLSDRDYFGTTQFGLGRPLSKIARFAPLAEIEASWAFA
jgi:hypothetical protein